MLKNKMIWGDFNCVINIVRLFLFVVVVIGDEMVKLDMAIKVSRINRIIGKWVMFLCLKY